MSLKLAISITGDPSSLKKAADESRAAVGTLGQAAATANAKIESSAEAAAAATSTVAKATGDAGKSAGTAASNVVQLSTGLDKAEASARAAATALGSASMSAEKLGASIDRRLNVKTAFGGTARAADIAAYGGALDDLRARYNPLFAAEQAHREQLTGIAQAQRVGAISAAEAAEAIARQEAVYGRQVRAINETRKALGQASGAMEGWRKQQLMAQGFDVFTSIGSGMNPATVAIQQGPQIIQAYGGFGATLRVLGALISPVAVGVGTLTAAVALGAVAWSSYDASSRAVTTSLAGIGRSSGSTRGQLEELAATSSASAGISIKSARAMEAAFLSTGRIGADQFGALIGLAKDFGATIGTDASGGADRLAQLIGDPAAGARQLQQIGLIDGATARLVQRLAEQNRLGEAQRAILDALPSRIAKASEATSIWARAWEAVATGASNAFDRVGRNVEQMVSGTSPESWLQELQRQRRDGGRRVPSVGWIGTDNAALDRQITDIEVTLTEGAKRAAARAAAASADLLGTRAIDLAKQSPANAEQAGFVQIGDTVSQLQAGRGQGRQTTDERLQIDKAIDAETRAKTTWISAAERQQKLNEIDIALRRARDPITRANLEAQREEVTLSGQVVGTIEAETRIREARQLVINGALADAERQSADLIAEAQARKIVLDAVANGNMGLADAQTRMQAEQTTRELSIAAMDAEGETRAKLFDRIRDLETAYAASALTERRQAALQQLSTGDDQIARLKAEIALVGQSDAVRTASLAGLEAEQRIRQQGIAGTDEARQLREQASATAALTEELRQRQAAEQSLRSNRNDLEQLPLELELVGQSEAVHRRRLALLQAEQQIREEGLSGGAADVLRANAAAVADATTELQRQQSAWQSWSDEAGGAIDRVVGDLASGKAGIDTLTSALEDASKWVAQLAIANPLKNALLGENNPTLSDVWDRISGKKIASDGLSSAIASTIGTMNVSAATVVIGGAGALGDLAGAANDNIGARARGIGSDFAAGASGANDNLDMAAAQRAIRTIESGSAAGNYSALGAIQPNGDRAYGAYQVMGANVPNWTRRWYGQALSPSQYLRNVDAQDAVFKGQFGSYAGRFGPGGAAQAWIGGPGSVGKLNLADSNGTTIGAYGSRFEGLYKQFAGLGNSADGAGKALLSAAGSADQLGGGLGDLSNGFASLAKSLTGSASAAANGNWLSNVIASMTPGATGWLYDAGGYTGPGGVHDPAGIVHRGEVVFSQADVRRLGGVGVVEGIRRGMSGYASGGAAGMTVRPILQTAAALSAKTQAAGGGAGGTQVTVVNNLGKASTATVSETPRPDGGRDMRIQLDEAVGAAMDRRGGPTWQGLAQRGAIPRTTRRGG